MAGAVDGFNEGIAEGRGYPLWQRLNLGGVLSKAIYTHLTTRVQGIGVEGWMVLMRLQWRVPSLFGAQPISARSRNLAAVISLKPFTDVVGFNEQSYFRV